MILILIGLAEILALSALVVGVIATIATIVVIHNTKLKYGLLISLTIVVLGSIVLLLRFSSGGEPPPKPTPEITLKTSKPQDETRNSASAEKKKSSGVKGPTVSTRPTQENAADKPKYEVTLMIPSHMSNADILVDERPAEIIDRQLTIVKIRVEQKNQPTNIRLRKGEQQCSQTLLIQKNVQLTPCA